jgi:acetyl-CoA C-acetyltransferase
MAGAGTSQVVIAGIGMLPVGEHWQLSLRNLAVQAIRLALADAPEVGRPQALFIGSMLSSPASHQANMAALVAEYANLVGIEGMTVEAAEASSGAALRQAQLAIQSGFIDSAIVLGVEKVTDYPSQDLDALIARSLDSDYESAVGLTPPAQAALLMQRYISEYSPSPEALAAFPILAHANAIANPLAMYRKPVSLQACLQTPPQVGPFNLYHMAPYADGAAALLLTRADKLPPEYRKRAVKITASSLISGRLALHDRTDPLFFEAAAVSVQEACKAAGLTIADMDFFEYHDATTLHALLSLEAAGFAHRGQAWQLAMNGTLSHNGALPCVTMGGCKARGYPLGASGAYQLAEAVLQLRGEAGGCQIKHAHRALVQNLGGTGTTAVTTILEGPSV